MLLAATRTEQHTLNNSSPTIEPQSRPIHHELAISSVGAYHPSTTTLPRSDDTGCPILAQAARERSSIWFDNRNVKRETRTSSRDDGSFTSGAAPASGSRSSDTRGDGVLLRPPNPSTSAPPTSDSEPKPERRGEVDAIRSVRTSEVGLDVGEHAGSGGLDRRARPGHQRLRRRRR
jgi:hypothetical protein